MSPLSPDALRQMVEQNHEQTEEGHMDLLRFRTLQRKP